MNHKVTSKTKNVFSALGSAESLMTMRYSILLTLLLTPALHSANKGEQLFAVKVYPLLEQKCFACHGEKDKRLRGGLNLTSRELMLKGGDSGEKVLIPGKGNESLLYKVTTWSSPDFEMPPKESDKLTKEQTWLIRDWINEGAPWPDESTRAAIRKEYVDQQKKGVRVQTSGGLSETWTNRPYQPENLWAYQSLKKPALPTVQDTGSPIDAFIQRRLNQLKIAPAPRASRRQLIRRATYDLLGLPPTPDDITAFVNDPASDEIAYERLIDRLLASPHYGEQWGRHWLDVVRYADSSGFANDYERPNAWRYRDYVIRAFNQDKPYSQFILEQLAGDEINPKDPELLIATGFLRMGPWEQTGMSVAKITRQLFLDDVTDIVGQVFLSHPLQCARCHDHKFDPIPTRDYYGVQAILGTTQFADRDAPFLPSENLNGFAQEQQYLKERMKYFQSILSEINRKTTAAAKKWYAERGLKFEPRNRLQARGVSEDKIAPRHVGLEAKDLGMERVARKNLVRLRWEMDRYRPIAFSVYSGKTRTLRNVSSRLMMPKNANEGKLEQTAILSGGDPFSPTIKVQPSALSMIGTPEIPEKISGRRLAFAKWVADRNNPITWRSIVNRVWQYHFGQGLAGNPNNFGAMGKKPTHPDLLDWLAAQFRDKGGSIKQLHKWIMTSDAYCRSSQHSSMKEVLQRDPQKQNYAVFLPRRLDAEEIRDSMIAITGEWNTEQGGIPIRPEINLEAALQPRQVMGTYAPAYQPSPLPQQRHRRTIYALRIRGLHDPFLDVFNKPGEDSSCECRESSTVTPQVFALFNNQGSHHRALALANQLIQKSESDAAAITQLFLKVYGRAPSDEEEQACLTHWQQMTVRHQKITPKHVEYPKVIERQAVEENTGEGFTFTEKLETVEDFVSDLKPNDVEPKVRGLAEVCLVLFCSNEFLYIP